MAQEKQLSEENANRQERRVKGSEIFVRGLTRSVTESHIRALFSPHGKIVDLRMIKDHKGTPKGFCFVRFATKESALKAQKEKDGFVLQGKKLGISPSSDQDSLFFGNLRKDWSFEEFDKLVRQAFQHVVSVDLAMPSNVDSALGKKQLNRGFAFVQFASHAVFGLLMMSSAAARAHRVGSGSDFLLAGDWHPVIDWAEKEPEIDPEELSKIKTAFIGNLPKNADEDYLKELFEPFGKLERIALSRKSNFPVGFVHFAKRSDLDNAIKEMDGKTVPGPRKGLNYKIQVSIARPVEKDRKRAREEVKGNQASKFVIRSHSFSDSQARDSVYDHKSKVPRHTDPVPDVADPYEAAVISLPSTVTERLLRILRLGIATRYDIDIQCISSLKELPESAAISVLDQFMLSGADRHNKGAYFASLVERHQVDKLGLNWNLSHFPRQSSSKESEKLGVPGPVRTQTTDPFASRSLGSASARYSGYSTTSGLYPYSSPLSDDPISRSGYGKLGEATSTFQGRTYSLGYGSGMRLGSHLPSAADNSLPERPQVKFDPFTGQPYKFDPFTGKPIQPEATKGRSGSFF